MKILKFYDYIKEDKVYIYKRKFSIKSLISSNIYDINLINDWITKYDCDEYAHCLFITKEPIKGDIQNIDLKLSNFDIKNKLFFNTEISKYSGYLPEDSKIKFGDNDVYLYIFRKNSNVKLRARQIHGFIYEGQLQHFNGLEKLDRLNKWDAKGNLDKRYLDFRLSNSKSMKYFDGKEYKNLVTIDDVTGFKEVNFNIISDDLKSPHFWNIKCMKNGTDVEMGDFKRIAGLKKVDNNIEVRQSNLKSFIFAVSFHVSGNIGDEYIMQMPIELWKTFLPNVEDNLDKIKSMYIELYNHRHKGERYLDKDIEWKKFVNKYKELTDSSIIKLRFKRDTKGQLRIQSSISYSNFMNIVSKIPHVRITSL